MTKFSILKGTKELRERLLRLHAFENDDFFILITEEGVQGWVVYARRGAYGVIEDIEFDFSIDESDKLFDALLRAVTLSLTEKMCPYVVYEAHDEKMAEKMRNSIFGDGKHDEELKEKIAQKEGFEKEKMLFVDGVKLFSAPCQAHRFV